MATAGWCQLGALPTLPWGLTVSIKCCPVTSSACQEPEDWWEVWPGPHGQLLQGQEACCSPGCVVCPCGPEGPGPAGRGSSTAAARPGRQGECKARQTPLPALPLEKLSSGVLSWRCLCRAWGNRRSGPCCRMSLLGQRGSAMLGLGSVGRGPQPEWPRDGQSLGLFWRVW